MESSENTTSTTTNYDASWTATTNWAMAAGDSLLNSVTFESSLSLLTDHNDDIDNTNSDDNHAHQSSTINSISKSPIVLCSPSHDSSPCEITINFAIKHEVRQVYVRSTARVYEIYCASELQSSSEYLCTVRCGVATRDEVVLHAADVGEACLAHTVKHNEEPAEEKLRNSSNLSPNEDDWVEVKALESPVVVNRISFASDLNSENNSQDLYEATAEFTDVNPCMSLTLRLLSLQNKGRVCVDEVYVFGDPVDLTNLDNQAGPVENSSGNSLMAMLVPAFFQLSNTKGIGGQDKYNIDSRERQKSEELGSKATDPVVVENKILEEVRLQEAVGSTSKPLQHEIPPQVSNTECKPETSLSHLEGVLDQLVSRVNRIEDLFLRFEESMLKPISSIDERLQRVELQLDLLTKKTENSELLSGTRICAPEFSYSESETNSFYNTGSRDCSYVSCEAFKNHFPSTLLSLPPDAIPVSVNDTKSQPSLVITAPEFSSYDDEEENQAIEPVKESPKEKQKHAVSVDDALAYALAGFLSSTSIQSQKYSQRLSVKAPDFPNEDENSNDSTVAPIFEFAINTDPSPCFTEHDGTAHMGSSLPSSISSLEGDGKAMRSVDDSSCMKMVGGVDEQCQHSDGKEGDEQCRHSDERKGDSQDTSTGHTTASVTHDVARTDSYNLSDDIKDGEVCDGIINITVLQNTDCLEQNSGNRTNNGSGTTNQVAVSNESVASTVVSEKESKQEILQSIVEPSHASSPLDFETPILEVKFVSQENSNTLSPLEALLAGMTDAKVEVPSVVENNVDASQIGDQCSLISVEDLEAVGSGSNTHISVDTDYYGVRDVHLNMEAGTPRDCYASSSQEMPPASLI